MSRRDAVLELEQLLRLYETGDKNVERHVAEHWAVIGPVLGAGTRKLEELGHVSTDGLVQSLRFALAHRKKEQAADKATVARQRAQAAADELARTATWNHHGALLETNLLLGALLDDPTTKYIGFDQPGFQTLAIPRATLRGFAELAPRLPGVTASVDPQALRLRWRNGRGGLNLKSAIVPQPQYDQLLHVVLERPAPMRVRHEPAHAPQHRGRWISDLLTELGLA
jgi:hypothetical protein